MKEFMHIGSVLQKELTRYGRESDGELVRIWEIWDETVGPAILENARAAAFKGTLLVVHVSSSPWAQQLQFLKQEMIQKLNRALKKDLITDIRFKVGPLR